MLKFSQTFYMECILAAVNYYNDHVFQHYESLDITIIQNELPAELRGGSTNYTQERIYDTFAKGNPDTFAQHHDIDQVLNELQIDETSLIVVGGGPIGLTLAALLCDKYPTRRILLIDARIEIDHVRKPYTRTRRLYGVGSMKINDVESTLHNALDQRPNIRYLFTDRLYVERICKVRGVKCVFDCTGGRFKEFQNRPYDNLMLTTDSTGKSIALFKNQYGTFLCRGPLNNKCEKNIRLVSQPEDVPGYDYVSRELVVTYEQGGRSIDFNIIDGTDPFTGAPQMMIPPDLTGQQSLKTVINQLNWYRERNMFYGVPDDALYEVNSWNPTKPVKISWFRAGLRFHHRRPADIHPVGTDSYLVKFDIGDTLGAVPIKYGTNIPIGRNIMLNLLLPAVDRVLQCTDNAAQAAQAAQAAAQAMAS